MTSKQQSQKQSASSLSVITSLLVVASCIFGLALVPIGMVDQVLQVLADSNIWATTVK